MRFVRDHEGITVLTRHPVVNAAHRRAVFGMRTRLGATAAVGALLAGLIKVLYGRARPAGAALLNEQTYSFPSGHAATSAAVAVILCYVLARERIISWPTAILVGGGLPLLVGLTRLYLNVHWTTDVVGGWTVGLFVAAMSAAVYERLRSSAPPAVDNAGSAVPG